MRSTLTFGPLENATEGAKKYDSDKPQMELLLNGCPHALEAIGKVLTYGVKKYGGKHGWKSLDDAIARYESASLRHQLALAKGETHDPESGFPHSWHIACNAPGGTAKREGSKMSKQQIEDLRELTDGFYAALETGNPERARTILAEVREISQDQSAALYVDAINEYGRVLA